MKIKVGDYLEITPLSNYCCLNVGERLPITRVEGSHVYWAYPGGGWREDGISQKDALYRFKHIPAKKQMENK